MNSLRELEQFRKRISAKVAPIKRNQDEDMFYWGGYIRGQEWCGFQLLSRYADVVSYIYNVPHKPKHRAASVVTIDWTAQDKEDLYQEILLEFFKLCKEYDPDKGTFAALIIGKLHRRVYNSFFSAVADAKINERALPEGVDFIDEVREILNTDEDEREITPEIANLYSAFNSLTDLQKNVVNLMVLKGWTLKESAEELGMTKQATRQAKQRAIKNMREYLEGMDIQ
ncbi:RNA polymerase sigma factor [Bacillus phage Eoghan]|uniref:RNA polymerase sigma-70 factor n=2 Tax=Andromedavirus TaxID=1623275 RepID=M1IER0_9CAUD|nr:RNA polymerase sigma factor [Bacillus phage Eoghan]YP_009592276.1 RNA polymerase sigma factor [Bacillus phage Taylor]AGE60807.1 RNA polymerase sigma-70 factor [Bacillus phage Eoghan]AGE60961.1 RNA polymerase sigma-70 factor [Bacillus phage Taylor]